MQTKKTKSALKASPECIAMLRKIRSDFDKFFDQNPMLQAPDACFTDLLIAFRDALAYEGDGMTPPERSNALTTIMQSVDLMVFSLQVHDFLQDYETLYLTEKEIINQNKI